MKQVAMVGAVLAVATWGFAQANPKPTAPNTSSAQAGTTTPATPSKRPPQAKTQPEYDAYKAAIALTDAAAQEKAADDFAAKFPDSELRLMLYQATLQSYQRAGNFDKVLEVGRKGLAIDGDDPGLLVTVANELAERTRDSDLDKDQRFDEAMKMAQKALQTVDTYVANHANTPPDQVDTYKRQLRSYAYSTIGGIEYKKEDFAAAEGDLRKSVDADPTHPDPIVVLKLAIALDRQGKYPDALKEANHAVDLTQDGTNAGKLARQERDRLNQLVGGNATAPKPTTPDQPKN